MSFYRNQLFVVFHKKFFNIFYLSPVFGILKMFIVVACKYEKVPPLPSKNHRDQVSTGHDVFFTLRNWNLQNLNWQKNEKEHEKLALTSN